MLKQAWLVSAVVWTIAVAALCLASFNDLPSVGGRQADKYVHFVFHFVFSALWLGYMRKAFPGMSFLSTAEWVFLAAVVFGICLEIAQEYFTQTRAADLLDVLANAAGALCGVAVGKLWYRGPHGHQKS